MKNKNLKAYILLILASLVWTYLAYNKFKEHPVIAVITASRCQPFLAEHLSLENKLIYIENKPKFIKLRKANYNFQKSGNDVINGIKCSAYFYKKLKNHTWRQVWIDDAGKTIALKDWTAYNSIKSSQTFFNAPINKITNVSFPQKLKPIRLWLPKGYILLSSDSTNDYSRYSYYDGLNIISVFITNLNQKPADGCYNWGNGLIYICRKPYKNIVVVGDLPVNEIKKIAQSVL